MMRAMVIGLLCLVAVALGSGPASAAHGGMFPQSCSDSQSLTATPNGGCIGLNGQ